MRKSLSSTTWPYRQGSGVLQLNLRFVDTLTWHKLWAWMVKALAGPGKQEGRYHYLVHKVEQYDIAALFRDLTRIIDTPTIMTHADELDALFLISFKPGQEIFAYLAEIKQLCAHGATHRR